MAKRPLKRTKVEIDPMFHIPDGVDELFYAEYETTGQEDIQEEVVADPPDLDAPVIIGIVKQEVRKLKSGAHVIDVIIEVEDFPEALSYEIRKDKL